MKKCLVLLLVLVMVLPMVLVKPAQAAVEKEPFYALGWSDFDNEAYPYLEGLLTTNFTNIGEYARLYYGSGSMLYGSYTDKDVTAVATAIKADLDKREPGTRYWHVFGPGKIMLLAPENVLFMEDGVTQLKDMFSAVLKKLKEMNCPLDGVVIDTEIYGLGSWYLWTQSGGHSIDWYNKNNQIYAQIVKNPKYKTLIRPLLEAYGFPFWPNPSGEKSEIYSICYKNKGEKYDQARNIWNTVMRVHLNNYANQWCYEPLKQYYPEASCSDYQSLDSKSWMKLSGITDDGVALSGGNSIKVGTASTYSYYFNHPADSFFEAYSQYASYNEGVFESSPFNSFLYEVNFTRHMYSSTDTKQIAPWITSYLYDRKADTPSTSMGETAYYTELLYHLGLFDPEPFLSYTYTGDLSGEGVWEKTCKVMNEIMAALTEVAGYADRKPIEMPQYWNAEYAVSGMYCNGRNLWRITPNTDEISLKDFKVKDADPTFSVKGQTITFPGGKILKDATISEVGSCGYWVETKAGVTPVLTSDKDRYAKYPSYLEDFSYANGAFNPEKMNETYAWKLEGSSAKIENKALSLSGTAKVQNVVIPGKITAGDSYAKDQTWELTVTVPDGLSKDAEINLLQYTGKNTDTDDGGIKLQGGKLYYSEMVAGEVQYQQLAEVKPGTYTIKRVMNFSSSDLSSYSVYLLDANGKEITNAKNIACPGFTAITSIDFAAKNANKAVLLDDYKLYPSGYATDFELYDAASGQNLRGDDAANARSKSTAYRLSWLNGTSAEKTATVMAAVYEGGKLVSEKAVKAVQMKPGCDGVETGIVEVKEGQSVKVYLKGGAHTDTQTSTPDATESTASTEATGGNKATAATKATTATTGKLTQPTRVTKTPTRATKATKATGQTVSTAATGETLATGETVAPEETLAPDTTGETLATTPEDMGDEAKGNPVILIAVIVGAVLAAGGVTTWLCLKKKKPAAPAAETPEETETPENN